MKLLKNSKYLILFLIIGFLVRLRYVNILPITNDEGAYLYDTLNIRNGLIPLKDFLTKSLPFIYTLSISQKIFGSSIIVGRMFMTLVSFFVSLLLYLFTKELFDKKIALISGVIYWSFPLIAAYTTLIHTEPFQIMLVLGSYLLLFRALNTKKIFNIVAASLTMTLAFFVRQSSIVLILLPSFYYLVSTFIFKQKIDKSFLFFTLITAVEIFIIFLFAFNFYGWQRTLELVGGGAVNLTIHEKGSLNSLQILLYPVKFVKEFVSESINMFRDGLIILIFSTLTTVYWYFGKVKKINSIKKLKIILFYSTIMIGIIWLLQFYFKLSTNDIKLDILPQTNTLLAAITLTVVLTSYLLKRKKILYLYFETPKYFFLIIWTLSLLGIYIIWIKFRSPYLIEFFPSIIILCSLSLNYFFEEIKAVYDKVYKNYLKIITIIFIVFAYTSSFYLNSSVYFTGLFLPSEVKIVSDYIKLEASESDSILTASAIFPYESRTNIIYNISHPAWYGYNNISEDTLLLYFPPISKIIDNLNRKESIFVIKDPFTDATYFRNKKLVDALNKNYVLVKTVGRAEIYKAND